jgi:hypothetical protein
MSFEIENCRNLEIASSKSGVVVDEPVEEDKPKKVL